MLSETHFLGQVTQKVLIKRREEFLMVQYPEGDKAAGFWDMPGGRLNEGETPLEGLQREVREEIGAEVSIGRIIGTGLITNMSNFRTFVVVHEAELVHPDRPLVLQVKEVGCAEWFSQEEIFSLPIIYPEYVTVLKKYFSPQ